MKASKKYSIIMMKEGHQLKEKLRLILLLGIIGSNQRPDTHSNIRAIATITHRLSPKGSTTLFNGQGPKPQL